MDKEANADSADPRPLMYDDYLRKVAERFEHRFADIAAEFNFELGVEFEITLCRVLRQVLPQRYGVCRGYVVTRDGSKRGDDIIIYARDGFPTLRLVEQEGFERKESIPVEAVYAYVEAKHTLCIEGEGGQSLSKACAQVRAVKSLPRSVVPWTFQDPYVAQLGAKAEPPTYWPESRNQMFGAILARYVRQRQGADPLDEAAAIKGSLAATNFGDPPHPDLIVAGADVVCLPTIHHGFHTPFQIPGASHLSSCHVQGLAFGIGICSLLFALDMMRIGPMPWPTRIAEVIGLRVVTEEQRGTEESAFSFPVYVVYSESGNGVQLVHSDDRTLVALFTSEDRANRFNAAASLEGVTLLVVESPGRLRSLLSDSARQGIDEVTFDPMPGRKDFLSIHIPFLFEYLDRSGREATATPPSGDPGCCDVTKEDSGRHE